MYPILFFIGVTLLLYVYITRNRHYWTKRGVAVASGCHWIFGHYLDFFTNKRHFGMIFKDVYNEYPDAPYVGFMKFSNPGLLIKDLDIIKAIFSNDFNSFADNEFMVDKKHDFLMGYNPFVLRGQDWKTSRGHATPLTTLSKLKLYLPAIRNVGNEMVKYIKENVDEGGFAELETKGLCGMYTTDVVANAILGIENNTFNDKNSLIAQLTNEIVFANGKLEHFKMMLTFTFPILSNVIGFRFSTKKSEKLLLALTKQIMKEKTDSDEVRSDIFQQMKVLRENDNTGVFTDEYIASHCFGFLIDGYETSSDALCFMLYEVSNKGPGDFCLGDNLLPPECIVDLAKRFSLAWHTAEQEKLRNEVMNMIQETEDQFSVEHVEKLKYLDMVACESLRLHPELSLFSKICTNDYTLPNTSFTIKKNTLVNIAAFGLHLDEKLFPNPMKFDPERFTDDAIAKRHKYAFLPFGEGPRKCLGQRFGLLQVKLAVIGILRNFRVTSSPKTNYPIEIDPATFITRPLNGAYIHFEEIKG